MKYGEYLHDVREFILDLIGKETPSVPAGYYSERSIVRRRALFLCLDFVMAYGISSDYAVEDKLKLIRSRIGVEVDHSIHIQWDEERVKVLGQVYNYVDKQIGYLDQE